MACVCVLTHVVLQCLQACNKISVCQSVRASFISVPLQVELKYMYLYSWAGEFPCRCAFCKEVTVTFGSTRNKNIQISEDICGEI